MFRQLAVADTDGQLSLIYTNAAIIQERYKSHSIYSKLAMLTYSLKQFENYRTVDYIRNNNERAMQVLHATNIFYSHFEKHLLKSKSVNEALVIYDNLIAYVRGVTAQIDKVNAARKEIASVRRAVTEQLLSSHDIEDFYTYYGVADVFREMDAEDAVVVGNNSLFVDAAIDHTSEIFSSEASNDEQEERSSSEMVKEMEGSLEFSDNEEILVGDYFDASTQSSQDDEEYNDVSIETDGETVEDDRKFARGASPRFFDTPSVSPHFSPINRALFDDTSEDVDFTSEEKQPLLRRS